MKIQVGMIVTIKGCSMVGIVTILLPECKSVCVRYQDGTSGTHKVKHVCKV